MNRLVAMLLGLACASTAFSADSVVIGRGVSNSFLSKVECTAGDLCVDARYVWVLSVARTIAGPTVQGKIRAVAFQHVDATPQFVRSVELFVLSPIDDSAPRGSSGADFYIVSLSPRGGDGRYCLDVDPETVGLHLKPGDIKFRENRYCFAATLL
jgi:hypothetical protein